MSPGTQKRYRGWFKSNGIRRNKFRLTPLANRSATSNSNWKYRQVNYIFRSFACLRAMIFNYPSGRNFFSRWIVQPKQRCKFGRAGFGLKFVKMFRANFKPAHKFFLQRRTLLLPVTVKAIELIKSSIKIFNCELWGEAYATGSPQFRVSWLIR